MKLLVVIILFATYHSTNALRCYTCTATADDVDQRCITNPEAVEVGSAITNCNKKYCTSMRVEYLDPKDTVQSMYRSCEDKPTYMNQVMEDGTFKIYFTACQKDLCNGGTGKDTSGGIITGDVGVPLTLLVPGTGTSSTIKFSTVIITLSLIILYFF